MNARDILNDLSAHPLVSIGNILGWTADADQTILRALRLLAAAEANDGATPETDKLDADGAEAIKKGDSSALSVGKAVLAMVVLARRLERERNGLAARVVELEPDAERWEALVAIWHEATELFLTQDEDGTWSIAINESVDNVAGHWDGDTPNAAIDAARSKP